MTPTHRQSATTSSDWPTTFPTDSTWIGCTAKSAAASQAASWDSIARPMMKTASVRHR